MKTTPSIAAIVLIMAELAFCQAPEPASPPTRVMGTLVKVEGTNLVVRPGLGAKARQEGRVREITIGIDQNTEFRLDGDPVKLDELKADMEVSIIRLARRDRQPRLLVTATSRGLSGTVVRVEGKKVVLRVVQTASAPKEVTVLTDESTQVRFLGGRVGGTFSEPKAGTLQDLKPAMRVKVVPATGTAKKIWIGPAVTPKP